jgi:hypothetical protein
MRKIFFLLATIVVLSTCCPAIIAQHRPEMPESNSREKIEEQKHIERIARVLGLPGSGPKLEPRIVKKGLLAPSPEDLTDKC